MTIRLIFYFAVTSSYPQTNKDTHGSDQRDKKKQNMFSAASVLLLLNKFDCRKLEDSLAMKENCVAVKNCQTAWLN